MGPVGPVAVRILQMELMMVVFGRIKNGQRDDLGDHRAGETTGLFEGRPGLFGQTFLVFIVIEDGRAILGAPIDELTAGVGGVDHPPKAIQQGFVTDALRIVEHLHGLGMSGLAGTDIRVSGMGLGAAGITGYNRHDTGYASEIGFGTPEASPGKCGGLGIASQIHHDACLSGFGSRMLRSACTFLTMTIRDR